MKTLFLKTYGKKKCKVSAWVSPESRKQAFDSTLSSDDDDYEPARATKRVKRSNVGDLRHARAAKKKAMVYLTEKSFDDENTSEVAAVILPPPHSLPVQESKIQRGKKTRVYSGRGTRPVKRKTVCKKINSSDEENFNMPCRPHRRINKITSKKSPPTSDPAISTPNQVLMNSNSGKDSMLAQKYDIDHHMKNTNVHPPSVGRFVTRRRRAATTKPQPPKAKVISCNSSADFSSGALGSSRILQPSKRRLPPTVILSSPENALNAADTSSFATNPLIERSLNELSTRKPIFCSTPAANPCGVHPRIKSFVLKDQCSPPLSGSVSCVGVLSLFQEDGHSSQQPIASVHSASPTGLHFQENLQLDLVKTPAPNQHHIEEPSRDLFREVTSKSITFSEHAKSISDDTKNNISGGSPSTALLSEDSESISYFASAAGGLEWLIEALKEKCLTEYCTVQLERLDILTVTQLCSQTTYSSCLEDELSLQSQKPNKHSVSVNSGQTNCLQSSEASFNLSLSGTNNENGTDLLSASSFDSFYQAASVTDGQRSHTHNFSPHDVVSSKQPNKRSRVAQTQCDDLESKRALLQNQCLTNKLSVNVKRETFSELNKILRRSTKSKSLIDVLDSSSRGQTNCDHQSGISQQTDHDKEDTFSKGVSMRKRTLTSSEVKIPTDKDSQRTSCDILPKRKKKPLAPKEKKRRTTSADRPGTTRKACVSGLSVSRWQNKSSTSTNLFRTRAAQSSSVKAVDSSINELISTHYNLPTGPGATMNFATPAKAIPLNLSSLLADLTPNTHTWSRLKAAISVHRKVLLTPRTPAVYNLDTSQDLFSTPLRTPLPKHLRSQLRDHHQLSHDSLVVSEDADLSDAEKVYHECGQECPLPWEECVLPEQMKRCVKIGEGTFGEVFSTTNASGDTVALKIIPLEGSKKVNGEDQKTFGEILHEIIISKELSSLKEKQQNQTCGFIGLNDLHCVQGCYPPDFLKAWDRFDKQKGSENDRPDFFEKDQFFLILEFEFGGIDLENSNGTLASLGVAMSILHQVTAALAVAEQELHFEHRDLHWGNILVKTTKEKSRSFTLNGTAHTIETKGVLVRIIDYSLSRLEIDELTVSCDISKDEELFMGQGDYQFEIYRLMREENGNNWADYHPHTNVLWLHYLCSKLLSMKYRGSRGKGVKVLREELNRFYDNILHYASATEVLQNCPMFQ